MANLTLLTDKMGLTGDPDPELSACTAVVRANVDCSTNQRGNLAWDLVCLTSVFLLISPFPKHFPAKFLGAKSSGPQWIFTVWLGHVRWCGWCWDLPFLTVITSSK